MALAPSAVEGPSSCKCSGVCSKKDGRKQKGCPCKTRGDFCSASCKCLMTSKKCQNQPDFVRPARRPRTRNPQASRSDASSSTTVNNNNNTERPSEMEECIRENAAVENLIVNLEEETVRRLAIRVLSRGIGSLEFIQSQLVADDESDEGPLINRHGSPMRPLTVRETPRQPIHPPSPDREPPPTDSPTTPDRTLPPPDGPATPDRPAGGPATPDRPRQQQLVPVPDWCRCGCCRQMPRAVENLCCKKKDCVTQTQRFYKLCLDPDILQLCILNRADIRNDPFDNSTRQFRKAAYRQFILDKYGYLGRGNRKVVPSCAVWKVRGRYPSPTGVYMGFRDD